MEIICSKAYFSLSYELFKFPKITQKWDWTKCFPYNSPLVKNIKFNLYELKDKYIRVIIKKNSST